MLRSILSRTIRHTQINVFNKNPNTKITRCFSSSIKHLNKKEYTETEEWLYHTMESTRLGLTQNAIDELGDLVYLEFLYEKGDIVKESEDIVHVESVKATNSIAAPYDLVILGKNTDLEDDLEHVNIDPENVDASWIIKIDKIP